MEVILLRNVNALGKEGDSVKVKDGYARNFLFPKKLAAPSTPQTLKLLESRKKKLKLIEEKQRKIAQELADKIAKLSITITVESGIEDMLFGSVTTEQIQNALREQDIDVDKKNVVIKEPIKKLGIYEAEIKVHPDIKTKLKVWVVKK